VPLEGRALGAPTGPLGGANLRAPTRPLGEGPEGPNQVPVRKDKRRFFKKWQSD